MDTVRVRIAYFLTSKLLRQLLGTRKAKPKTRTDHQGETGPLQDSKGGDGQACGTGEGGSLNFLLLFFQPKKRKGRGKGEGEKEVGTPDDGEGGQVVVQKTLGHPAGAYRWHPP